MRIVALISNPFRAKHCVAYLKSEGSSHTLMTGDPHAFDNHELAPSTRVLKVTPPPELLPTARLARSRWYQRILALLRTGSALGSWLERTIKRIVWRLRYFDRLTILVRRSESRPMNDSAIRDSSMYRQLTAEHTTHPIDQVVVFDVLDLPVGLRFAEDNQLDVLVR